MVHWLDRHGTRHDVAITIAVARRLQRELQIDLLAPLKTLDLEPVFRRLAEHPEDIVGVLQIVDEAPDPEAFAELFDGEALESAGEALLQAICDFFPQRQRPVLQKLLATCDQAATQISDRSLTQAMQMMDQPDFITALQQSLIRGNGSSASPEPSASIPTDSPSASCSGAGTDTCISSTGSPEPSLPESSMPIAADDRIASGHSPTFIRTTQFAWEGQPGSR